MAKKIHNFSFEKLMRRMDTIPRLFQGALIALALAFVVLAGFSIYDMARSVTDENLFVNAPSNVMLEQAVPALLGNSGDEKTVPGVGDSTLLEKGDLITLLNHDKPQNLDEFISLLKALPPQKPVSVAINRPSQQKKFLAQIAPGEWKPATADWLPPAVMVINVTKNGASDRAGMKVGDLIVCINGKSFKSAMDADRIMRSSTDSKSIAYDIIRGGLPQTLHVDLARFGLKFSVLVMLFSGVFFFASGLFVALARPQLKAARLVGLSLFLMGFFMIFAITRQNLPFYGLNALRSIATWSCLFLGLATMFHSDYYYPVENPALLKRRWLRYFPYVLALFFIAMVIMQIEGYWALTGILSMIASKAIIKIVYRQKKNRERARQMRVVHWSVGIAISAAILLSIAINLLGRGDLIGYIGFPLALIPAAHLYTIGRYRLFNLDLRVRRNIQYNISAVVFAIMMAVFWLSALYGLVTWQGQVPNIRLTGSSIEIIDLPLTAAQRAIAEKSVAVVLALFLTYVIECFYRRGRQLLNAKFFRTRYDYRHTTDQFNQLLSKRRNQQDLAGSLARLIAQLMHLKQVGLIVFRKPGVLAAAAVHGMEDQGWEQFVIHQAHACQLLFAQNPESSRYHVDYVPPRLKEAMRSANLRYLVPVRASNTLLGLLLAGEKLAEAPYYQDDLEYLDILARQSAIAIENSFLYEEVAGQERIRHELELARRIQVSSLPQQTPRIAGLDIAAISIPAAEVGGDYYDYFVENPHLISIIVGDVSGKGISAALYMSKIQGIFRSLHSQLPDPRELLIRTNAVLYENMEKNYFVTASCARIDTESGQMNFTRAGHVPLFFYNHSSGTARMITPKGMGLGLRADGSFERELESQLIAISSGDLFILATDGITEALGKKEDTSGEECMLQLLRKNSSVPLEKLRDYITEQARHDGAESLPPDDQTLVIVRVL